MTTISVQSMRFPLGLQQLGLRSAAWLVCRQLAPQAWACALFVCAMLLTTQAQAQAQAHVPAEAATGTVRKVDLAASKITLKHGEIKSLDMPPMTMVFTVQDTSTLAQLQVGDQVRFVAVVHNGKMVVTELVRVP